MVLRFDFSNIGRQPATLGRRLPFAQSTIRETQAAMDFLGASRGRSRFLLIGNCAGADHAVRVAGEELRVVGLGLVDAYASPPPPIIFIGTRDAWRRPASWWNLLAGRSQFWGILGRLVGARSVRARPGAAVSPAPASDRRSGRWWAACSRWPAREWPCTCCTQAGAPRTFTIARAWRARSGRCASPGVSASARSPMSTTCSHRWRRRTPWSRTLCEWAESVSSAGADRPAVPAVAPGPGARAARP